MTGNPYTFTLLASVRTGDDIVVQAEDWSDTHGHRTHIGVSVDNDRGVESMTFIIGTAEEARRLKNLFAVIERRLQWPES